MPACDSSIRVLCVEVDPKIKGLDLNDHVGGDARAVLDLLVESECPMTVEVAGEDEVGGGVEAVYESGVFRFYNLIVNTTEASQHFGIRVSDVGLAIDKGLLTGVRSEGNFRWMVLKDSKWDAFKKESLDSYTRPERRNVERSGVGLKRQVTEIVKKGQVPAAGFTVADVRKALSALGWEIGQNYAASSLPSVLSRLESEKLVRLEKIGRMENRVWSVTGKRVSSSVVSASVAPSPKAIGGRIDEMVESLSDIVVERVRDRAKQKLGL
jgi:hypothetical protein